MPDTLTENYNTCEVYNLYTQIQRLRPPTTTITFKNGNTVVIHGLGEYKTITKLVAHMKLLKQQHCDHTAHKTCKQCGAKK